MGLLRSREEERREREEQYKSERRIKDLHRFTGSLSEYCSLMGGDYIVMDTGRPRKFLFVDANEETKLLQKLIDEGCIGLIRYTPVEYTSYGYANCGDGIPIRKK